MIMIIDYNFLSYVIFDQQLKITFRKSSGPPEKTHSPLFTHSHPKNSKSESLPLFANIENFSDPPAERGGEDTVASLMPCVVYSHYTT